MIPFGMASLVELERYLAQLGSAVLGYSGGVDSALLAAAGTRALGAERFLAVIGRSASYPAVQYRQAVALARQFSVPLLELDTHELDDPRYRANATDRCYFCKHELWTELGEVATTRGFVHVLDGTNADDTTEHRPGMRAAAEHAVLSPLAELGWRKADVRAAAKSLGIPSWDAPASPCLASRLRYGVAVTPERLAQVEAAERGLRALGVRGNLRVRHLGQGASVEVDPPEIPRLQARWAEAEQVVLAAGFPRVSLDPHGYRRGALLALADSA